MRCFQLEVEAGDRVAIAAQAVIFDDGTYAERWFGPGRRTTIRDSAYGTWAGSVSTVEGRGPRRFHLDRDLDISGVSGTGVVARGVLWADGTTVLHWLGEHPTTTQGPSMAGVESIHGHNGTTKVVWLDPDPDVTPAAGMQANKEEHR